MKRFIKMIAYTLIVVSVTLLGGNSTPVKAQDLNDNITEIQINDFENSINKINKTITVTESKVIFDKDEAHNIGFTDKEIKNLDSMYTGINKMIKNNQACIIKTTNGNYDVKINDTLDNNLNENSIKTPLSRSNHTHIRNIPGGYNIYFDATKCSDVAAALAGGAATTASIAGVLGLTGVGIPYAVALTIASGVMGIASAYMWYCSNHNGLDVIYKHGKFSYHKHTN